MDEQNNSEQNEQEDKDNSIGQPEVQNELSKVAANPKQSIAILVVICVIFGYLFFNLFITGKEEEKVKPQPAVPTVVNKPAQSIDNSPSIPQLPEPPKLVEPSAPPPPPPVTEKEAAKPTSDKAPAAVTQPPIPGDNTVLPPEQLASQGSPSFLPSNLLDEDEKKRKEVKRKSSIVLMAGTETKKTAEQIEQETDFKERGNMELLLGRGKVIDAVLESAVNTDFGGEVRAVVSRDIYSESNKLILIPKGSRVFGTYTTDTNGAYGRIAIVWNRIDLASGYTLNLKGDAIDNLGRKGVQGRVDNKYKERFTNALLTSAFNIGFANAIDKVVAPPETSKVSAANLDTANAIRTNSLAIFSDTTLTSTVKIANICTNVKNAITDKTSDAYKQINTTCYNIQSSPTTQGSSPDQQLQTLMNSLNGVADSLVQTTSQNTTPSKAQEASKQAFTDVTAAVKEMVGQNKFQPTITIDQGRPVKIYVNKDYKFPKAAIRKSRLLK